MVQYATAAELQTFMQRELDTATADLALTIASALFDRAAGTSFEATNSTYTIEARGRFHVSLPLTPVISIVQVRINGLPITDYTRINERLYRRGGFGVWHAFPPDQLDVDYTYGRVGVPDDVKGGVLETGAIAYDNPDLAVVAEHIDDYSVSTAPNLGGFVLSATAEKLAAYYGGVPVA